mmetsp:Transcript_5799/g.16288  ORF Transcript_5799/g.16288 Transcript_5799/m.16288 type:complete len:246 (-) Transcript_5799:431-1168(-)
MLPHDAVIHKHLDGVDENLGVQPRVGRLARVVGDVTHGHLVHLVHPRPDVPVLVVLPHPDLLAAHGHRGVAGEDACLQPAGLFYQVLLRSVGPEHGEAEERRRAPLVEDGNGCRGRLCRRARHRRDRGMRLHWKGQEGVVRRRGAYPDQLLFLGVPRPTLATTLAGSRGFALRQPPGLLGGVKGLRGGLAVSSTGSVATLQPPARLPLLVLTSNVSRPGLVVRSFVPFVLAVVGVLVVSAMLLGG